MNKFITYHTEIAATVSVMSHNLLGDHFECGCCGEKREVRTGTTGVFFDGDEARTAFICSECAPEANRTGGQNIKRASLLPDEELEQMLLKSPGWLDAELLRRNKSQPFIRRPLFAEVVKSQGHLTQDMAVVIQRKNFRFLQRKVLPFPFPWHDSEFMAGARAAQEALQFLAEVKKGNIEIATFGGNMMASGTEDALRRVYRAGTPIGARQ